jgi:RNA-directed DNA polymerase
MQKTIKDWQAPERYGGTERIRRCAESVTGEMTEMYRKQNPLMEKVVAQSNMMKAIGHVRQRKGAPGIDGMTVYTVEHHIRQYYQPLKRKLLDGTYRPQAVKTVNIPKPAGGTRKLGIPTARDRVIQQAVRQVIEPIIDPQFSNQSHGFRPNRSTHTALKQCVDYYERGYKVVVDCDLKQCFDTLNHDKLMYHFEQFISDKAIVTFIRKSLMSGSIDMNQHFIENDTGAPQGGVISPLLCNVYLNELDKTLSERGHRFVRYADDFMIFVRSKRAAERVMQSTTRYIEKYLKLTVNTEKSEVGSPTRLKFLSCLIMKTRGDCRFRPSPAAKQRFKRTLKHVTRRNRPGTFQEIVTQINQVTRGWINYFGQGFVKRYLKSLESWFHHRLRQLILKRWKQPKTIISQLQRYGLDLDSAKRIGFSRKKYWRLSKTPEMHIAINTEKLHRWGVLSLPALAENAYARY